MKDSHIAIVVVVVLLVIIVLAFITFSKKTTSCTVIDDANDGCHHFDHKKDDHHHHPPHPHPAPQCPGCDIVRYDDFRIQEYDTATPGDPSEYPVPVNYGLSPFFEALLPPDVSAELKNEYLAGAVIQEDEMLVLDNEPMNQAFVPVFPPVPFDLSGIGPILNANHNFGIRQGDVFTWEVEASFDFNYDHDAVQAYYGASNLANGDPDYDPRVISPAIIIFASEIIKNGLGDVIASATATACFFFTKKAVWAYYDTADLPIGPPFATSFFSQGRKVKEFDTSKKHVYKLEHDSRTGTHRWYIDGVVVRTVNNIGFYDPMQPGDTFVWRGGTEQPIHPTNAQIILQGGARGKLSEGIIQNDLSVGSGLESSGLGGMVPNTYVIGSPTPQPIFAKGRFYKATVRRSRP